jgi:DNA-binding NarL/FixJ family response regulator
MAASISRRGTLLARKVRGVTFFNENLAHYPGMLGSPSTEISVVVCDGQALFREGLCAILRGEAAFDLVGQALSGSEAVEVASRLHPDVVLMDVDLPGLPVAEAARRIQGLRPPSRVVILTVHDDEDTVAECLDAGVSGYVLKDEGPPELLHAIREAYEGKTYTSARAAARVARRTHGRTRTRYDLLTGREREVLKRIADGQSSRAIAACLGLSTKTVNVHRYNLMRKLDMHDRTALVMYALRRGLIRIPETPASR